MNLYTLGFLTKSYGRGVAIVAAHDANEAYTVLVSYGQLNHTPEEYGEILDIKNSGCSSFDIPTLLEEELTAIKVITGEPGNDGKSIYELCVKNGTFEGTEEEFVAKYNAAVSKAESMAAEAQKIVETGVSLETEVKANEETRKAAEIKRNTAEEARVKAELQRVQNDKDRRNNISEALEQVDAAIEESKQASSDAKTETQRASDAADNAEASALKAQSAAENVEEAVTNAHTAAESAINAAETAKSATENTVKATSAAISATSEAVKATTNANNVIEKAENTEATLASNEETRIQNENIRKENETTRQTTEGTRVYNEKIRVSNEESRVKEESSRVTAETSRKRAEELRVSQEETRVSEETKRADAESVRVSSEESRVKAEDSRVTAELGRVSAEKGRVKAEDARVTEFNSKVKEVTTATSNAAAATTAAQTATTEAKTATTATEAATTEAKQATINTNTATSNANAAAKRVDESISKANTAATNADTATTKATAAAATATTAADKADKAREAIEKEDAVLTSHPQTLTDAQQLQARENIGAEFLHRALGKYDTIGEKTLSVGTSGKYIDVNGNEVSNSAYAISAPVSLNKGDDLLIPSASPVAAAVSVVSRKITNTYDEPIIYDIAYDGDKIATATAQYDKTLVYTAVYEDDALTGWTMGGTSYESLPATHSVTRSFYVPLVNQSVAAMPDTGYYVFPADEAMEVVISAFTATVSGGVCKVYGVGLIKNNATNMVGQTRQHVLAEVIAELSARLEAMEAMLAGEVGHLSVHDLTVLRALNGVNLDGGMTLKGAGAPSADILPERWDADRYGAWVGVPQFIGQIYIDTTNKIAYMAFGVASISDWSRISNA